MTVDVAILGLVVTASLVLAALILGLMAFKRQTAVLAEHAELLDLAHDAILVWDLKTGEIRFWNHGAVELYGWTRAETLGRTPQAILKTQFPLPLAAINAELVRSGRWEGELIHTRRDGTPLIMASRWALKRDRQGQPVAVLGINTDITSRKHTEEALERQALHDALTGLPNRALFQDRLNRALALADRAEAGVAVLFLDLDNFKLVNDSLGHQAGDLVLAEVAQRLKACMRPSDTVARLGGDEFTILLEDIEQGSDALNVARRIAEELKTPIQVLEREVFVTASIGIALSTLRAGGSDIALSSLRAGGPDNLLRDADIALYQAKGAGKARCSVFDTGMNELALERLELETDLRNALELGQLRIHYQPIWSLTDGEPIEVEALLRWERPGHGLVPPARFIPVAEETGLIVPIGRWVLEEACRQGQIWNAQRLSAAPLIISVNLSARQFQDPGLLEDILSAAKLAHFDLSKLKLEITESVAMQDVEASASKLEELKALGVQLAIDDFGTGYSSLNYLKRFPVDTLKIDRSFVEKLGHDLDDAAIVQSVVALAKALRLNVVGEGIETRAQAAELRALGCDRGKGYLFARPLAADALTRLLNERHAGVIRRVA